MSMKTTDHHRGLKNELVASRGPRAEQIHAPVIPETRVSSLFRPAGQEPSHAQGYLEATMQKYKRVSVNLKPDQVTALKERFAETGVPQNEQVRRALNLALFGDAQAARRSARQPVLFTQQKETR
jgi:hypothetical protein